MSKEPRLFPEDQHKVDEFLKRGVNSVERKPFRPMRLLAILLLMVTGLSGLSLLLASQIGI